jgi:hypothetical protein
MSQVPQEGTYSDVIVQMNSNRQSAHIASEEVNFGEGIWMAVSTDKILMAKDIPIDAICLDGAATSHMVPYCLQQQRNILQNFREFDQPQMVEVGGGHFLKSFGVGLLADWEIQVESDCSGKTAVHSTV